MGLFDEVAGMLGGQQGGAAGAMALVQQLLTQEGGLQGLLQKFEQGGLGEVVASWTGNGQNLPVSAAQIVQVLGDGRINQLAATLGMDSQQVGQQLAQHLPGLVDHLSPNGQLPDANALLAEGASLLKGFFS
jgi:uncharacterized protein YidB (DUF937 family)